MAAKRILIAEDEALIALDVQDQLTEAGYLVVGPAHRLDAALRFAEAEPLDAAILDVNLGGTLIWPVAETLVARGIPFVLMTGFGAELDAPESCRHAPTLPKPFTAESLAAVVAAITGGA